MPAKCESDGFIKLQVHWIDDALCPAVWDIGNEKLTVLKAGFDTYCGIPVYIVKEINTIRLIANSLVIGEKHFKEHVECQS